MKTKHVKRRGSFASYRYPKDKNAYRVDVDELACVLLAQENIPKKLNDTRIFEIGILAATYQKLRKNK